MDGVTYTGEVGRLLEAISHYLGDDFKAIPVTCRRREFSDCRVIFAGYMRDVAGVGPADIAGMLGKDRTTVYHLFDVFDSWKQLPNAYKRQLIAFDNFCKCLKINTI